MKLSHAKKWADALWYGTHEKEGGRMSNMYDIDIALNPDNKPSSMCCLCVASEALKPEGYLFDRVETTAGVLASAGYLKDNNPEIFGICAANINDGFIESHKIGIPLDGLSHKEIAILIDLAVVTGEYKNI